MKPPNLRAAATSCASAATRNRALMASSPQSRSHGMPPSPVLATPEAAVYLSVSRSWIEKARLQGRGPRYIRCGGRVLYRITDLDAFLSGAAVETMDSRDPCRPTLQQAANA